MTTLDKIAILGAQLDLGAARRGVDMGPSAIRYAGLQERLELLGLDVHDYGNVSVEIPEVASVRDEKVRYLPEILRSCSQLAHKLVDVLNEDFFPLVLGGDHSIAIGTLAGLNQRYGRGGVMWIDAHSDLNRPETSPSGNVHGMPLATALGACGFSLEDLEPPAWVDPARVAIVGARQLDQGEKDLVQDLGLCVLTMSDVDRRGIASVMHEAMTVVQGPNFVHVSLDIDVCDPEIAPGVGTPVRGGLSYREAHLAMELISEAGIMTSLEVVEVNPVLDNGGATGALAVELISSGLGAKIL